MKSRGTVALNNQLVKDLSEVMDGEIVFITSTNFPVPSSDLTYPPIDFIKKYSGDTVPFKSSNRRLFTCEQYFYKNFITKITVCIMKTKRIHNILTVYNILLPLSL